MSGHQRVPDGFAPSLYCRTRDPWQLEVITAADVSTRDDLQRWEDLGVTRLVVCPWRRGSEAVEGLQCFAEDVMLQ